MDTKKRLLRFAQSIWTQLILQNPSEEFVKAYNAYFNWMKENTEETEEDRICLIHDELCNEMADCHLISRKANLAPIADEKKKVGTLGTNHTCPAYEAIKPTAIKTATTFHGFCRYHDSKIFEPLESGKIDQYSQEQVFLLCLRAAASKRYQEGKKAQQGRFLRRSFRAPEVIELLRQLLIRDCLIDQVCNRRNIGKAELCLRAGKYIVSYRHQVKVFSSMAEKEHAAFDRLTVSLVDRWKRKDPPRMKFSHFKVETQKIAFSEGFRFRCGRKDRFFFLFVLPNGGHSDVVTACLESDYQQLIKYNPPLLDCFHGDIKTIERIINIENDVVVFSGKEFEDYEYMKYVYESGNPVQDLFVPNLLH